MGLPFCVLFQLLITSCGQTSRNMHSPIFLSCCRLYLHENKRQGWQTWRHNQSLLSILRRIDLPDRDRDRCRKDRYGDCLQSGLVPQVPFTRWQSTLPSLGLAGMVASYVKGNLLLFKFYLANIWKLHQLPQVITSILFHQTTAIIISLVDAEPGLAPGSGRGESCCWRWRFHPQTASNSCQVQFLSSRVGFDNQLAHQELQRRVWPAEGWAETASCRGERADQLPNYAPSPLQAINLPNFWLEFP